MKNGIEKHGIFGSILERNFLDFLEKNPPVLRGAESSSTMSVVSFIPIKVKKVPISVVYEGFDEAMLNPQDTNTFYIDAHITCMVKGNLRRMGMDGLLIQNPRGVRLVLNSSIDEYRSSLLEEPPPHPLAIMLQSIGSDDGEEFFLAYS